MKSSTRITLIVLGLGVIISLIIWQCNKHKTQILPTLIVHDTVIKRLFIYDTVKDAKLLIPDRVTYYDTAWKHDTTLRVEVYHDTISLTLHDTPYQDYHVTFLEAYPKSPKLILGEFGQNKISFSLLNTDGTIIGKEYTPDYSTYNYEFSGNDLKFYPIKKEGSISKLTKNFTTQSFLSSTYNPFTNGATIRLDYSLMYKRIGATSFYSFSTDQIPHSNIGIGLKVQLK